MVEAQTSFEYDDSGRREQTVYPDNLVPSRSVTYGYDDMDRLRSETHQPATFESWEYDSIGNRRYNAEVENGQTTMLSEYTYGGGAGDPLLTEVRTYRDGEGEVEHQVLYDAIGNVVSDGVGGCTYDLRNKMVEQSAAAAGSPPEVRYRYDTRGYRVLATSQLAGNGSVDWVLDPGGKQLIERTFDQYGQLGGEVAFVSLGVQLLTRIEGAEVKHVISNHIAFPVLVADGTGAILWHARADAFGEPVELLAGLEAEDPLRRYPGQWAAAQTMTPVSRSLYYNGPRWYDSAQGRFAQSDPLGLNAGVNLFSYAHGNPLLMFDPTGLESLCVRCNEWDRMMISTRIVQVGAIQTGMLNPDIGLPPPATSDYPTGVTYCAGHGPHFGGSPFTRFQNLGNGDCADACTRAHEQVHRENCRMLGYDDPPLAVPGTFGIDFDEGFAYLAEYECLKRALLEDRVTVDVDPIGPFKQ